MKKENLEALQGFCYLILMIIAPIIFGYIFIRAIPDETISLTLKIFVGAVFILYLGILIYVVIEVIKKIKKSKKM